jgi:hypothetical protein
LAALLRHLHGGVATVVGRTIRGARRAGGEFRCTIGVSSPAGRRMLHRELRHALRAVVSALGAARCAFHSGP